MININKLIFLFFIEYPTFGCSRVAFKSHHGKYVVAESNGAANADRDKRDAWETFTVEEVECDSVALKSFHGKYLVAEDGSKGYEVNANRDHRSGWEIFKVIKQPNGTVAFRTAHGRYLVAEDNGKLRADRTSIREWETFTPVCVSGKSMRALNLEVFFVLILNIVNGKYLNRF